MKKPRIVTGFSRYRDTDLETKARTILESLANNASFANPVPSLAELKTATDNYSTALSQAQNGGKKETAVKKESRLLLEEMLYRLALYVELTVGANELLLISSGYSLAKTEEPIGILPKPENFMVKSTEKGMAKLKTEAIHGAHNYQFEYRLATTEEWTVAMSSKSSLLLTGLVSGAEYEFRVVAIGTAAEKTYSNEVRSFIL